MGTPDPIMQFGQLLENYRNLPNQNVDQYCSEQSVQGLEMFEKLLKNFRRLPQPTTRPKTLLEIAGVPHRELSHSAILAFFLDPNEEHGFEDLFLKSLLETCLQGDSYWEWRHEGVQVDPEDLTESKKRVDRDGN